MSQQINLFNPLFRKQGFSWTSAQTMLYGVGIMIVLSVLYSAYLSYRLRVVRSEAQNVEQQYQAVSARRDQLQAAQAQRKPNTQLADEITTLQAKLQARQQIVEILQSGALGTTSGFSEYMRAFSRQAVNGLWLTGFNIGSNDLVIEGRTLSPDLLPNYLKRLNQEPALQGKQFAMLNIDRPKAEPASEDAKSASPPAAEGPKSEQTADATKKLALPRFLEFSISTGETTEPATK